MQPVNSDYIERDDWPPQHLLTDVLHHSRNLLIKVKFTIFFIYMTFTFKKLATLGSALQIFIYVRIAWDSCRVKIEIQ